MAELHNSAEQVPSHIVCKECAGADIENCVPAFFKTNDGLEYVLVDFDASHER